MEIYQTIILKSLKVSKLLGRKCRLELEGTMTIENRYEAIWSNFLLNEEKCNFVEHYLV